MGDGSLMRLQAIFLTKLKNRVAGCPRFFTVLQMGWVNAPTYNFTTTPLDYKASSLN
jgi:hypothetical protein